MNGVLVPSVIFLGIGVSELASKGGESAFEIVLRWIETQPGGVKRLMLSGALAVWALPTLFEGWKSIHEVFGSERHRKSIERELRILKLRYEIQSIRISNKLSELSDEAALGALLLRKHDLTPRKSLSPFTRFALGAMGAATTPLILLCWVFYLVPTSRGVSLFDWIGTFLALLVLATLGGAFSLLLGRRAPLWLLPLLGASGTLFPYLVMAALY